jgi:hypothetical protein
MQNITYLRLTAAVTALFLSITPYMGHAQYAFNSVPAAKEGVYEADPEVGKAPTSGTMKVIHGVIQSEQGALPGATVWLKGSRTIVVTNAEGAFELQVPADAKTVKLVCGYGGLQEEELTLTPVQAMGSIYLLQTKQASKK